MVLAVADNSLADEDSSLAMVDTVPAVEDTVLAVETDIPGGSDRTDMLLLADWLDKLLLAGWSDERVGEGIRELLVEMMGHFEILGPAVARQYLEKFI